MALYEITQDCRIANNEYQRWDIVSDSEVGGFYPTVMRITNWEQTQIKVEKTQPVNLDTKGKEEKQEEEKKLPKKQQKKK